LAAPILLTLGLVHLADKDPEGEQKGRGYVRGTISAVFTPIVAIFVFWGVPVLFAIYGHQ
jgi:hypothetical protein